MKILALDTSALTASCAVMEDNILRGEISFTTSLTHSQTIMPMIDSLLKGTHFSLSEMDALACSVGPGSFTGIRIGLGTIKGLGYGSDKKVIGVSTLEALSYNVPYPDILISPIMDARRGQVYNALYRMENQRAVCVEPDRALEIEELCSSIHEKCVFVGDGVRVYKDKIKSLLGENALFAPDHLCLQKASSVCYAASFHEAVSPDEISAFYLRKSQAERELEEKKKNSK